MQIMNKRIVLLAICAAFTTSLISCGDSNEPVTTNNNSGGETVSSAETADPTTIPPEATDKYAGRTYRIFNGFGLETKYIEPNIYPEEMTGDVYSDSLYQRCMDTEDRLGITIEVMDGTLSQIKTSVAAADDFADLTFADLSNVMSLVLENYCIDFYEIPNISLDKVWWDQNAEEKLSFEGKLFYTFNDSITTQTDNCRTIYFNKEMATDLQLPNLYDMVRNGTWTFDKLEEYALMAVSDLNGDTRFDGNDRYGIVNWGVTGLGEALLTGADCEIVMQGDDGVPYFNCFTERFNTVYTRILDIMNNGNLFYVGNAVNMLKSGQALFIVDSLGSAPNLRDTDVDFGILPIPKYDEEQESYWNVSPNPHAMLVPVTCSDLDFAGAVMEEMAYQSHITVLPAYYDNMLKGKVARDEDSLEMLDLIHNSVSYVIKIIGVEFSDAIYTEMANDNYDLSSMLASWQESVETQLDEVLSQFKN